MPDLAPDFWLPERLAKLSVFIEAERDTYRKYLAIVKEWLDAIRNPVLGPGGVPGVDAMGVFAGDLVWQHGVDSFVQSAVLPVLGRAYAEQFEGDFEFTHRPFVINHLAAVTNRLVGVPNQVFEDIQVVVGAGAMAGNSIPEIAVDIKQKLLDAGSQLWKERATTVARTETLSAYNGGTNDAFHAVEETLDVPMEKVWLATEDSRTRHTHNVADGQRVPLASAFMVGGATLEFPGDPTGPPQEVINCRCTMLLVEPGEAVDLSDRQLLASGQPGRAGALVASVHLPLGEALLAAGLPTDMVTVFADGFDHSDCLLQFCRFPKVHPGPCKGWKHTLKQIAPGVYNALEAARIQKLEAKRKAKIAELKAQGKPVPKHLLKPITTIEPKPPPALPGQVGVPPMVGTEAPLSPETEAKLAAVSKKVKHEFDPATVAAKKAAKEKAVKLAEAAATLKAAQAKKAADEQAKAAAKAEADKAAAAKAAQAQQKQVGVPPTMDGDKPATPEGFIPTIEQDAATKAAEQGANLPDGERLNAYTLLDADDYAELPGHVQAKILADLAAMAQGKNDGSLAPFDKALAANRYKAFAGQDPPAAPSAPTAAPAAPGVKPGPPPVDPAKALAKAESILALPSVSGRLKHYDKLSKEEFDALPEETQGKIAADLIAMHGSKNAIVSGLAKNHYKAYVGKSVPSDTAPDSPPDPDQPNTTTVPSTPEPLVESATAAKAATIAQNPKNTHWKDRLTAYAALTQADVDSLSDADLNNIAADLSALHAWMTKKKLALGAKNVQGIIDDLAKKIGHKDQPGPALAEPDWVDALLAPDVPVAHPKPRGTKPKGLKSTGKKLGTHGATVHTDENGKKWLVKKQAPFLAETDAVTADLAKAAGVPAPKIHKMQVDGQDASVQEMIPGQDTFPHMKINPAEMSDADVLAMQKQQVLDWLTANHDSHAGNFITTEDGEIVGIDKGQAFKWFGKDKLDPNWKPNEHPSAYSAMWKAYANGENITMNDPNSGELGEFIASLQGMPDDEFKEMFRAYAEMAAAEGKLTSAGKNPWGDALAPASFPPNDVEAFLDALVKRKNSLAGDFDKLYQEQKAKRDKKKTKEAGPTSGVTESGAMPAPAAPAAPAYNTWTQTTVDILDDPSYTVTAKAHKAAGLNKGEYDSLTPWDKSKVLHALEAYDGEEQSPYIAYEYFTGVPHPKSATATSTTPAPAPAVDAPAVPAQPKDTLAEWQQAKQVVKDKKGGYKAGVKQVADAIKTGTAQQRLTAYNNIPPSTFEDLPDEIQSAIIRDLDNIATAPGGTFSETQKAQAGALRSKLTGLPVGAPPSPTFGQPKKFQSKAAEASYHLAKNPQATNQQKLATYTKLSASSFASLPAATQKQIAQQLVDINEDPNSTLPQSNQAVLLHKKLTGLPVGEFKDAAPKPKSKPKKKFVSDNAEAAWNAAQLPPLYPYVSSNADKQAKFDAYAQLTKEEFESLPSTTQKQIHKDLLAIPTSSSPIHWSDVDALQQKLGIIGYNWKPKTAAQKKAEKIAAMSPAEQAKLASDFSESGDFNNKLKQAVSGQAALGAAPRSLVASGSRSLANTPTTDGVTAGQMASAIGAYKGSAYSTINGVLRNAKHGPVPSGSSAAERIQAIDAAMTASRLTAPVQVWRGFNSTGADALFGAHKFGDLTGVEFTEFGYASTSASKSLSGSFAGGSGILLRVVVPPGVGAVQVSGSEYESELLLERGLRFRVVSDSGPSGYGQRRLDVEVVYP